MGKPGTKSDRLESVLLKADFDGNTFESTVQAFRRELAACQDAEQAYRKTVSLERRKHFGQFFTPESIARLMAEWIAEVQPNLVLDPAIGPGVFVRVIREMLPNTRFIGLDIDELAIRAARLVLEDDSRIVLDQHDFLTWPDERLFDAAIANPPYLRHHDLNYGFDVFQLVGTKNHVRLSKLSNVYVLFILEICRRLRVGARAAVIVPGEWVNANFGDKLKLWLISRGLLHTLVYFSHASTQFEDALTTASILFLERPQINRGREKIRTIFVHDGCALEVVKAALHGRDVEQDGNVVVQDFDPERLLTEKKWNHVLAHGHTEFMPGYVKLLELADTRRGIATGCNSYFHLAPSSVKTHRLRAANLTPCIGRATDVAGTIFTQQDFEALVARDSRTYLFDMRGEPDDAERQYIEQGMAGKLHDRYLCAARDKWYEMEKRLPSPIWAAVFGRSGLRFVHNSAGIANLTTFHCVYPKISGARFAAALTACLNSRVVQNRAKRQHRVYGGGLLKFEPKDLLDIEVPDLREVSDETLDRLCKVLATLDEQMRIGADLAPIVSKLDVFVQEAADEAALAQQQSAKCVAVQA